MDGKSLDITEEKRNRLKEVLPEAFTEDKIDWEKLKATLGEDVEFKNERYVLNWAGKSDAFRVLQSPPPQLWCRVRKNPLVLTIRKISLSRVKTWKC
ncbi:MAG: hypothetical protein U9N12_04900 [Euryarchaeota archaeon]|nr:hypothetical protein [Euryarchaeota archaeon]